MDCDTLPDTPTTTRPTPAPPRAVESPKTRLLGTLPANPIPDPVVITPASVISKHWKPDDQATGTLALDIWSTDPVTLPSAQLLAIVETSARPMAVKLLPDGVVRVVVGSMVACGRAEQSIQNVLRKHELLPFAKFRHWSDRASARVLHDGVREGQPEIVSHNQLRALVLPPTRNGYKAEQVTAADGTWYVKLTPRD